ncbi:MAG: DUF3329 domain-containing protein [Rhizobiaceae bacterium]|jgi:hypothetical protein|nr:DUF3329 domain-containing protein [Rhizobiaceae bacterium]
MAQKFLDADHPFFKPVWRRWVVLAACFGWAGVELYNGAHVWAALFGGAGAYAAWELFLKPRNTRPPE